MTKNIPNRNNNIKQHQQQQKQQSILCILRKKRKLFENVENDLQPRYKMDMDFRIVAMNNDDVWAAERALLSTQTSVFPVFPLKMDI